MIYLRSNYRQHAVNRKPFKHLTPQLSDVNKEEKKMNHKKLTTTIVTATLLTTLLVPMFLAQITAAITVTGDYITVDGVLGSDTYTLYPYAEKSLDVGLSKYGELIDSDTNVGLEYAGARDPFAAPAGSGLVSKLPKNVWINGWYIALTYNHSSWGERYIWAGALFADLTSYAGPWLHVDSVTESGEDFRDSGYEIDASGNIVGTTLQWGGRKTNGTATTEDIQILFDGPRQFVAMLVNHIYDYHEGSQTKLHLVDVIFTIIFNKVKKEIIVLKDVKRIEQPKYVFAPLMLDLAGPETVYEFPESILVQFSNREEWDLGAPTDYASYVHFYTAGGAVDESNDTCYNDDWTMIQTLPANYSLSSTLLDTSPLALYGSQPTSSGTYDVAQIISNDRLYVGWAAYWPSLSDWSADAGSGRANLWWRAMKTADRHDTDSFTTPNDEPFLAPLTIGEWDFVLNPEISTIAGVSVAPQFRGVAVYGVTDRNDGDDVNRSGGANVIDKEVKYQLAEVYNPWDLSDAVNKKDTSRWWKQFTGTGTTLSPLPVDVEWGQYCNFSERVTNKATGALMVRGVNYSFNAATGVISGLPMGTYVVRWSSRVWYETIDETDFGPGRYEWFVAGRQAHTVDSIGSGLVTASIKQKNKTIGIGGMDFMGLTYDYEIPYTLNKYGTGNNYSDYFLTPDASDPGQRLCLRDNWCTKWPVTSSNMLSIGGPLANWLTMYFNDFTDAFYGASWFTPYVPWKSKIVALPCWNKTEAANAYINSGGKTGVGYATIGTYKDINGTVGLIVYGLDARDTYFATQWLHGDAARGLNPGILQLQEAPCGLTSIILRITYTDPEHPTFCIPECLGTISETEWVHNYINIYTGANVTETKGGIHDP
jgi:hypothetical protein